MNTDPKRKRKTRKPKSVPPELLPWSELRLVLMRRFGSVTRAAHVMDCHPNSLRNLDRCPDLKDKLKEALSS